MERWKPIDGHEGYNALTPAAPTVAQYIGEQIGYADLAQDKPDREAVLARRQKLGQKENA